MTPTLVLLGLLLFLVVCKLVQPRRYDKNHDNYWMD